MVVRTEYAVILDAGSSGTRIYIYEWNVTDKQAKVLKTDGWPEPKTEPGIHELAPSIQSIPDHSGPVHISHQVVIHESASIAAAATLKRVSQYLDPLVSQARQFLPREKLTSIPLFLLATAGMRRLKEHRLEEYSVLLSAIDQYLTTCGFADATYSTISGEDEALYGWVATNYIDRRFRAAGETHGFMEMGGESAQFAVCLQDPEYGGYTGELRQVTLGGVTHRVFVKSWLGLGGDSAWKRHEERLRQSESAIPHDPCSPKEFAFRLSGSDKIVLGTANPVQCLKETFQLLSCPDPKCRDGDLCIFRSAKQNNTLSTGCLLKDPVSGLPYMTFDTKKFDGASVFWHAMHGIFPRADGSDDFSRLWTEVESLSLKTWEQIREDKVATETRFLKKAFFTSAMVMAILFYGFGIPMPEAAFTATKSIAEERATRARDLAAAVEATANKKHKTAEKARVRAVSRALDADKKAIQANWYSENEALWPTKADADACKHLYDSRPNEANRQDMIATMSWGKTGADDRNVTALEAARAARVTRAEFTAVATETYSTWVKAKGNFRQAKSLLERLPELPVDNHLEGEKKEAQYTSVAHADWPLGHIVLHANGSSVEVKTAKGWKV